MFKGHPFNAWYQLKGDTYLNKQQLKGARWVAFSGHQTIKDYKLQLSVFRVSKTSGWFIVFFSGRPKVCSVRTKHFQLILGISLVKSNLSKCENKKWDEKN